MILSAGGVLAAAGASAAAILLPAGRARACAMLVALALFPALILGDQWHSPQIVDLREEPTSFAALGIAALAGAGILAACFRRWPVALPLAIVFALPFRVPLEAGGDTANLLVPLYLVIAGGVLSTALGELKEGGGFQRRAASRFSHSPLSERLGASGEKPSARLEPPTLLPCVLAAVVVLYALQALYSPDFSKSLQNVCFFFVPFSLVYALLRDVEWNRKLLVLVLWVIALEAVAFVIVGSVEYLTRELFWNDQVIRSNEFHTYFRVNSIFWDPNIYGRYLALVTTIAMAALLWAKEKRTLALLTGLVAVLWFGLVPTFSQSSFAALLAGLAVLAALRWSLKWTLAAVGMGAVLAVIVILFTGGNSTISPDRINIDTGGRLNLVSGGGELFAQRPIWGYGSGSFPRAYREHIATKKAPVSVSHTQPVTVAAEQGLIGLAAYAALLIAALWTMSSGLFARQSVGRAAVLAAFVALLVHTMAYAGFYEDPISWVLLAVGASLASSQVRDGT
ncbi:MAG TPA: O-antigen ligase family protein [Solirubrobacterales bacterium]|nr:O-antigen ligase family protein [Solirubrobacterales bacterium]